MSYQEKRCRNCRQLLLMHQRYCHQCGQKTDTHRINFHYLLHEVPHSIFHVDGGIIYTLKELFTRPGHSIRDYLEGKRQQHFKPVMLVLIMGSLCALIQYLVKEKEPVTDMELFKGDISGTPISKYIDFNGFVSYFRQIVDWLSGHFAFTVLLMVPVAAFGFFLGFRKYKLNYPEWFTIFLFLAGQALAVYIVFIFLNRYAGDFKALFFLVGWGLVIFTLTQLFEEADKKYVFMRSVWAIFLSYFFSFVYLLFAMIIIVLIGLMLYGYDSLIPMLNSGKVTLE